ncbi:histidinol-phosphatase HisJ family protein [Oceanispirochaeta crateris]|uniref:Histidinol-phosphatase n=1 Tax=Oceanispirochaeta crateris TaxID=2518645 RepID=A0A5C1QQJ0_9SPIO|nr:histidinol-phosphatase [Oceanispirochaeta crateris]QEN08392.1 histidinol-phosphatase HisJ family protein [Oceanispirochaeta crateris]
MKTNYHTHCNFCDGFGDPETIIKTAIDKGIDILGFSSHSPIEGEDWTLAADEVPVYVQRIRELGEKYKESILILAGMEMDFIATNSCWPIKSWGDQSLDYVIGSVHWLYSQKLDRLMSVDGPEKELSMLIDKGYDGNARQMVEDYYHSIALMITREHFDFLGHLDVVKKRNKALGFLNEKEDWYLKKVISVLELLRKKEVPLEINTGGISRGATEDLYPSQPILRECCKRNIPILINSDSHNPDHLDSHFEMARDAAMDAGYREQMILDLDGWKSIPL